MLWRHFFECASLVFFFPFTINTIIKRLSPILLRIQNIDLWKYNTSWSRIFCQSNFEAIAAKLALQDQSQSFGEGGGKPIFSALADPRLRIIGRFHSILKHRETLCDQLNAYCRFMS